MSCHLMESLLPQVVFQTHFLPVKPEQPYLTVKLHSASELVLDCAAGWTRNPPEVPANLSYPVILTCSLSWDQTASQALIYS